MISHRSSACIPPRIRPTPADALPRPHPRASLLDPAGAWYGARILPPAGPELREALAANPSLTVVGREPNGLVEVPGADAARAGTPADAVQRLYMWEGYEDAIRSGAKRSTVRVDDPFVPGPAEIVVEREDGSVGVLGCVVESVRTCRRCDLTAEDARRDGFAGPAELHAALDGHYPGLGPEEPVDVVGFRLRG